MTEKSPVRPPEGTIVALPIPIDLFDALAARVAELVTQHSASERTADSPWLDVSGVASYAAMTEDAVRGATKRGQLHAYRSTTGRLRYRVEDVDAFLRGETA